MPSIERASWTSCGVEIRKLSASRVRKSRGGAEVWDGGHGGAVYGPWLEGVGSRNATTRFKGYWAFRKATSALDHAIEEIGDRLFRSRYHRRLE